MSAELLERATRALRMTTERSERASEAQLERALERLERAQRASARSPRWLRTTAWTLAATLAGAGAWAHATGRVSWFASVAEPAAAPVAPAPARQGLRTEPHAAPVPEIAVPDVAVPDVAVPDVAVPRRVAAPKAGQKPAPVEPQLERADELYRDAHAAHFVRRDYGAALIAWDRYLAAAGPAHRWTVEARFNRGVALFRLGQAAAARRALRPFAEGEYGSYRREEAAALLEALRSAP